MELAAEEPGMIGKFNYFNKGIIRRCSTDDQAFGNQFLAQLRIELITVTMPFVDFFLIVGRMGKGRLVKIAGIAAKPQGAAHIRILIPDLHLLGAVVVPFFHQINNRIRGFTIKFRAVCVLHPGNVSGKLHNRQLHAEANTEIGNFLGPGIIDGQNLAFNTALAKAARHENAVASSQGIGGTAFFEFISADITQFNLGIIGNTAMHKGFMKALV